MEKMTGRPQVRVRRVYDDPSPEDGARVLVDRIWPRGLAKAVAGIDEWAKAVAPSTELRRWYGHDPGRFEEFRRRYRAELAGPEPQAALRHLQELARSGPLTLLTATRDIDHSQAAVLAEQLRPRRHTMATEETNLPKLAAPARRALHGAGYTRLEDLTKVSESEVMKLHGMGANAMQVLRNALRERGLSFRDG